MKRLITYMAVALMFGVTTGTIVANAMATEEYEATQNASISYPSGYAGIANTYAKDLNRYEWASYMDAVNWLDESWCPAEEGPVTISWRPSKMVTRPHHGEDPGLDILIKLANGKSVRTFKPCYEIYK